VGDTKSTTKTETNVVERIFGWDHKETTISDGKDSVTRAGRTAEEAEERASESWEKVKEERED
jgi:hypothetical protein